MINVDLTVREAIRMICDVGYESDMGKRLVNAIANKCGEFAGHVTVTVHSIKPDAMIACIKVVRSALGWGLKESKEFFDVVRGPYTWGAGEYDTSVGKPNTLTAKGELVHKMVAELRSLGCVVTTTNP